MALHDITLTYAELSVVFRYWKGADLPRSRKTFVTENSYSASGNFIKSGTSFELPYIWTIACDLYQADYDKLKAIWERLDATRRANSTPLFVTIDDESEEIFEYGKTALSKTRTSVTGTTPRELNGGVYYFARFQADLSAPSIFGQAYSSTRYTPDRSVLANQISIRSVSLVLQDTGVKI